MNFINSIFFLLIYTASEHSYGDKFKGRHLNGYKTGHHKPYSSIVHGCRGYRCNFEGYGFVERAVLINFPYILLVFSFTNMHIYIYTHTHIDFFYINFWNSLLWSFTISWIFVYSSRPNHEAYYSQNLPSEDNLATTFTQSSGLPNHPVSSDDSGLIINQANAQTAILNFGPFSASFSTSNSLSVSNAPTK